MMNTFYHVRYRFYRPSQKEHKIFAISDIHFSRKTTTNLTKIVKAAEQESPTIITISGDIIDNLDNIKSASEQERLKNWLTKLAHIAPVCICLGNHDFYRKPANFKSGLSDRGYIAEKNQDYIDLVNSIENVHLLDNAVYEDKEFYVCGLTLPPEYYHFDYINERHSTITDPGSEDIDVLSSQIDLIKTTNLPKHKTKILLVHSPALLTRPSIAPRLAEFDFVFAGHMHNGVVPPLINEIWRGHHGIITPSRHLFADQNTRIGYYAENLIVLGAVTTIQGGAKPLGWLNRAFPINYTTVETSHNENYARKPDIRKKYGNENIS